MKHFVRRMQALAASLVVVAAGLQAQKAPRDMDRFIHPQKSVFQVLWLPALRSSWT